MGTIPVVPNLSGAAEYISPFFPDAIYKEDDIMDLGKTLINIESMDRLRLDKARLWVAENLNLATISKQVLDVYSKVLSQSEYHVIQRENEVSITS
jgi:glycosyltransferase involved in cell wall biosynthesis